MRTICPLALLAFATSGWAGEGWPQPFSPPCTQREEVFAFTSRPEVKALGDDKYPIHFTVKGYCDVTLSILDEQGRVIRHLACGVLGPNAPAPFQKGSLSQTVYWDGKDDLECYLKAPEKARVRIALGLKPAFDRILGWCPYDTDDWDIGGDLRAYQAAVADESGAYVLLGARPQLRHYGHQGEYARTVIPPPAGSPLKDLTGYTVLENGPGGGHLHEHYMSRQGTGAYFRMVHYAHAAVFGGQMILGKGNLYDFDTIRLSDGATGRMRFPRPPGGGFKQTSYVPEFLACSPDGSKLYVSGLHTDGPQYAWGHAVFCLEPGKDRPARVFAGVPGQLGTDDGHFQYTAGIDCDAQGRLYVCDPQNGRQGRIQVFSDQGVYLKTLAVAYPFDLRIDRKTGAIHVLQVFEKTRGGGRASYNPQHWNGPALACGLVRLKSFEDPRETAALEIPNPPGGWGGRSGPFFALDYWCHPARVWVSGDHLNLRVFESAAEGFKACLDFNEETKKSGNLPIMMKCGPLPHDTAEFVMADPVRGQAYLYGWQGLALRWDLATGKPERMNFPTHSWTTPRAFSARGYLYAHLHGMLTRHDPGTGFREVPFDYGEEPGPGAGGSQTNLGGCVGVIPLRDQGYDGHTGGLGVNMRGDMAVLSVIAHVPKFEDDESIQQALRDTRLGQRPTEASGSSMYVVLAQGEGAKGVAFKNEVLARQMRGESVYSVKPYAGRILAGSTAWVFDATGEQRSEDIIPGLGLASGIEIDQEGSLYTLFAMRRLTGGRPFLAGGLKVMGAASAGAIEHPTSTLLKTSPKGAQIYSKRSPIPMTPWPERPMDVEEGWVENASWLYGGACHLQVWGPRHGLDWYQRALVPENYRHSAGILDSNGNLILHLGRYGNADSGRGPESPVKIGGDEIAFSYIHGIAATDDHLIIGDFGNLRLVVLKLEYQVEETLPLAGGFRR